MSEHEAVVVGGGIVGASTAYHLARAGTDTLLVDRAHEGRATDAGAGLVAEGVIGGDDPDAWFAFAGAAARYYPELAARLEADGVADHGYGGAPLLCVASPGEREAFDAELERVRARADRVGYPDPDSVRELSGEEATERFPALADVDRAFVCDEAARVDGRRFADALRRAGREHGLDELDATVESVRVADGAVTGAVAGGEAYDADAVVVAGGAWSAAFADDLDCSIPVEPQRGELVHLGVGDDASDWPMVSRVGGHYLVPWVDGRVIAGASRGPVGDGAAHRTAGGVHEVLGDALAVAPGLTDAEIREIRVGLRPVTPDGRPALGGVPGVEGAYLATGHGPNGLHLGPYSGKRVAERVRGEVDDLPALFDPGRFD